MEARYQGKPKRRCHAYQPAAGEYFNRAATLLPVDVIMPRPDKEPIIFLLD